MDETTSFGAWLSYRRKALDLTQAELARRLGCATVTLQKIELDERRPSKDIAERLADALQIAPEERTGFLRSARGELTIDRLAVEGVSHAAPRAPWAPPPRSHHNLPVQRDPIIGRERESAEVTALLRRPDVGLVTLTGPGGTGKTRLSQQVAAELLDNFADGVWFVDLAPISDPELVLARIAQAIGVREVSGQSLLEGVKAALSPKHSLLLLDNFEQVLDAAPLVGEFLQAALWLKVLVTSRALLHLYGEHEVAVPPLAVPDITHLPALDALSQYPAVALFIQRAYAVKADFQVTNQNAPAIAEICTRLDGLPLAIELAAARVKVLPPAALLVRLEHRLQLLTGGARDLNARQQTLRSTIAWSYHLLTAEEQAVFARLGVFVGGCTLEAAEAVCTAEGTLDLDILESVTSLVDKSLVQQREDAGGEPRFTMLETIHEYARERLQAGGEATAVHARHAGYHVALAERGAPELYFQIGTPGVTWLDRMETEHGNVRAALRWMIEQHEVEPALRLSTVLGRFWASRGTAGEGRQWLAEALRLAASEGADAPLRARGLYAAAILAGYQSDLSQSITLLTESATLFHAAGDERGRAWALLEKGHNAAWVLEEAGHVRALWNESLKLFRAVDDIPGLIMVLTRLSDLVRRRGEQALLAEGAALVHRLTDTRAHAQALYELGRATAGAGDYPRARTLFTQSLSLYRKSGDHWRVATVLDEIGAVARNNGDYAWAIRLGEESLTLFEELGDKSGLAHALHNLGEIALMQGDDARARELEPTSEALYRELSNEVDMCWPMINLGYLALHQGDDAQAGVLWAKSLAILVEARLAFGIATCLAALASLAACRRQPERGARLFGAAERLHETAGLGPAPAHTIEIERTLAVARAAVDDVTWDAAWTEGRAMTLEGAVAYALSDET